MRNLGMISADQLDWYVGREDCILIDLRERKKYEISHIKGAINMPYENLTEHVCLPYDKTLVLYCERGSSSLAEGKHLAEEGYHVKTVIGGMHAYRGKYLVN